MMGTGVAMWVRGDEIQQRAQSMAGAKFERTFRHLWLVGEFDASGQPQREAKASFHTDTEQDSDPGFIEPAFTVAFRKKPSCFALHPVEKSASNPWLERVTFGRTRNNDIVMPHTSVSKLHGYFQLEANDEGTWRIHDVGSKNRLHVDGVEVPPHGSLVVRSGTQLTIGTHSYEIMDSALVHALLAAPPPR